jgi:hypothetical protein
MRIGAMVVDTFERPLGGDGHHSTDRKKSRQAITGYVSTLIRIQAAFEQAGIQFIDDDENGDTAFA